MISFLKCRYICIVKYLKKHMFEWRQCLSVSNRLLMVSSSFFPSQTHLPDYSRSSQLSGDSLSSCYSPELSPPHSNRDRRRSWNLFCTSPVCLEHPACQNPVQLVRPDCSLPAWSLPWLSTQKRTYNFACKFFSHMGVYSQGYSTHHLWCPYPCERGSVGQKG